MTSTRRAKERKEDKREYKVEIKSEKIITTNDYKTVIILIFSAKGITTMIRKRITSSS